MPKKTIAKSAAKVAARTQGVSVITLKTPTVGKSTAAGRLVAEAKKVAAKNAVAKRRMEKQHHTLKAQSGTYEVYGSPLQPRHITQEQIAQAIAELD